jgi:hypothetical protein
MARGGKREGSGRKQGARDRVSVLVRLDRELQQRIDLLRNGKSMSSTVEGLLRSAVRNPQNDDENANRALGFVVEQAAQAATWRDKTWLNDAATAAALKKALPAIVDLFAVPEGEANHPLFSSPEEHARMIYIWLLKRLEERGDEHGTDWPAGHPLRNFPKAAAALAYAAKPANMKGTS